MIFTPVEGGIDRELSARAQGQPAEAVSTPFLTACETVGK